MVQKIRIRIRSINETKFETKRKPNLPFPIPLPCVSLSSLVSLSLVVPDTSLSYPLVFLFPSHILQIYRFSPSFLLFMELNLVLSTSVEPSYPTFFLQFSRNLAPFRALAYFLRKTKLRNKSFALSSCFSITFPLFGSTVCPLDSLDSGTMSSLSPRSQSRIIERFRRTNQFCETSNFSRDQ